MTMRFGFWKSIWLALAAIAGGVFSMYGQNAANTSGDWRQRPQALRPAGTDTVSPEIRAARDKFFDRVLGNRPPGGGSVWESVGPEPEVVASGTAAIVQFTDFATIQSSSKRSIYTEVKMNVERVIHDPSGTARPGKPLTVILGGGTLRLPSGRVVRRDLNGKRLYGVQPGHRYLIFLSYQQGGDYFLYDKSWDLTSGAAVPNTADDAARATTGQSRFAGMPEDKFIAAVETGFAASSKPSDGK